VHFASLAADSPDRMSQKEIDTVVEALRAVRDHDTCLQGDATSLEAQIMKSSVLSYQKNLYTTLQVNDTQKKLLLSFYW